MKGFYSLVQTAAAIGVIVSAILCIFIPVVGIIALIVNICVVSSASKEIKRRD